MLGGFMRLPAALVYVFLFAATALVGCGGDDSNYGTNLFDNPFSSEQSLSSSAKYSSSSSSKYNSSSSVDKVHSSSSSYFNGTEQLYSADTTVKYLSDLPDSCSDYDKAYVQKNENLYRCMYGKWFQEVHKIPECNEKSEWTSYFRNFLYVCQDEEWREMTEIEVRVGFCTKSKQGKTATANGVSYICDSLSWEKQTVTDVFGECKDANAGDSIFYSGKSYVCRKGNWNPLSSEEKEFGICTKSRSGEVVNENNRYYYICKDYAWTSTTKPDDILGKCDNTKTDSIFRISSSSYVCESGTWRTATSAETSYGLCNAKKQDSTRTSGSYKYICDKGTWRLATAEEYYGACTDSLKDITYSYDSKLYACYNLKWNVLPEPPVSSMAYCTKKNNGSTYRTTSPRTYYACINYQWTTIDSLSYYYGLCIVDSLSHRIYPNKDSLGYECKKISDTYQWVRMTIKEQFGLECDATTQDTMVVGQVCDNGSWRAYNSLEKTVGKFCTNKNLGEVIKKGSNYYECKSTGWATSNENAYIMYTTPCNADNDSTFMKGKPVFLMCSEGKWSMVVGTSVQYCGVSGGEGNIGCDEEMTQLYQCQNRSWVSLDSIVLKEGMCTQKREGKIVGFKKCENGAWRNISLKEKFEVTPCSEKITYGEYTYICSGGTWSLDYTYLKDSRDQKSYRALKVGEQTWMIDNLNYNATNSWCYQNIDRNCDTYGRLYTWDAAKTACPTGWHLPDAYEYRDLLSALAYTEIRDLDYWQQDPYGGSSYGVSIFELRGTGIRTDNGTFDYDRRLAGLWYKDSSLTNADTAYAYIKYVASTIPSEYYSSSNIHHFEIVGNTVVRNSPAGYRFTKETGLNVRCVKDSK